MKNRYFPAILASALICSSCSTTSSSVKKNESLEQKTSEDDSATVGSTADDVVSVMLPGYNIIRYDFLPRIGRLFRRDKDGE